MISPRLTCLMCCAGYWDGVRSSAPYFCSFHEPPPAAPGFWPAPLCWPLSFTCCTGCPMSAQPRSTRRRPGESPGAKVIGARASLAMTHQEIIQRFENDAVAEDSFHHVDHV